MGYMDGMSLYEYVSSNPAGWLDPYGMSAIDGGVEDVSDPSKMKGGGLGETDPTPGGHIWVKVTCGQENGRWEVTNVDDSYVVKSRIATTDLIVKTRNWDPNKQGDRDKAQKLRENIKRYEENIRKGLAGSWNSAAKEHTQTIKKLSDNSKGALVKKVHSEVDRWLDEFAGDMHLIIEMDARQAGYRPPTVEQLRRKVGSTVDVRIGEADELTTRPSTQTSQ